MAYQTSHLPLELPGFYSQMDKTGPWKAIPIIIAAAQPGGPVLQHVFDEFMAIAEDGLRTALPLDGVYVCSHGGSSSTGDLDNDGTLVAMVRRVVGPEIPVVVTHDLHCNVSERLIDAADALIAYKTNPHVDHRECAAGAADVLRLLLSGVKTHQAFIRLPIAPPGVTMLMDGPYGDLIRMGQSLTREPILDVSVTAGFVLSDLPKCGFTVNVTSNGDKAAADRVAREIAEAAWANRHRYIRELTSLEAATKLAREADAGERAPVLLADIADNPGGGARGNTVWILRALHNAAVSGAILGLFTDVPLSDDAWQAGEGTSFDAVFNRVESQFAERFTCRAKVLKLSDGSDVGRRGRDADRQIVLGRSALLELEGSGVRVVVTRLREQLCDPRMFEMFGVDIAAASCVVIKSRGHFRAGFDEFFEPSQIYEVDTPGLTSAHLTNFRFKRLPRPIWPLDRETSWSLPAAV